MVAQPHYLLFCDTHHSEHTFSEAPLTGTASGSGRWHFVLERLDGPERLEAADSEASVNRERLALLSVVRGLEALEQPSQVTLVTTSRYVDRGLRYGLNNWRDADYMWERFGEQRPVRNSDLWRRVDTAMQFHGVKCRLIQAGQAPAAPLTSRAASGASVAANLALHADNRPLHGVHLPLPHSPLALPVAPFANVHINPNNPPVSYHASSSQTSARFLRNQAGMWQPSTHGWWRELLAVHWWSLAAAWIRWWRGRMQAKPAFYAT